jgi:hypothetical protein
MAGDDVIERGQGSLVRHMGHRDVERGFEQLAHEVMEGAGAARTVMSVPPPGANGTTKLT